MSPADDEQLSAAAWREIDGVCDSFEANWEAGQRPNMAEFLGGATDQRLRRTLLQELLAFAVEQRLLAGESPQASDYADLHADVEALFVAAIQRATDKDMDLRDSADGRLTSVSRFSEQAAVGKFRLLDRLGSGAFGEVWKAEDTELQRIVALKLPLSPLVNDRDRELFFREAQAVADLQHRGVVRLLDAGSVGSQAYLASDYIEGATLRDWLAARRLGFREAALLVQRLAEALDYAHSRGVVHRDVKPTNILIDLASQPLITDFGLAKRLAADATISVDNRIVGSPGYMSPEQAAGRSDEADSRSDVYSLGIVLFELLTGETPFRGDALVVLQKIQRDEAPRPRQLNPRIPHDLETIALACIKKDPSQRYQSAQALADELGRFLRHEPILARPAGFMERGWQWCRRHPAASAITAALVAATTVSSVFALTARRESLRAQQAEQQAVERATEYQRLAYSVEARYELDRGLLREAFQNVIAALRIKRSWHDEHLLARIVGASRQNWTLVSRLDCRQPIVQGFFIPGERDQFLVQAEDRRTLTLYDLRRSIPLSTVTLDAGASHWRPVSKSIAAVVGNDRQLILLDLPQLNLQNAQPLRRPVLSLAASPKGDRFAAICNDGSVTLYSVPNGRSVGLNNIPLANNPRYRSAMQASFSPAGEQLVMTNGEWTNRPVLWRFNKDETIILPHMQQHYVQFLDETSMVGAYYATDSSDVLALHVYDAKPELPPEGAKTKWFPGNSRGQARVWLAAAGAQDDTDEDARFRVAVFGDEAVSTIDGWSNALTSRIEHPSLLPHRDEIPLALDLTIDGPRIALAAGKTVYVFERRPVSSHPLAPQITVPTRFWSIALSQRSVFTPSARVTVDNRGLLRVFSLELAQPSSRGDHLIMPWGMAVTRDERLLAVLYQESNQGGTISADYFGKILVIYELVGDSGAGGTAPFYRLRKEFRLKDYEGLEGRKNRGVRFTPDGKRLTFVTSDSRATTYDVENGQPLATIRIGYSVEFSPDGRFLAHGRFAQEGPISIVDLTEGRMISQTKTRQKFHRMCFDDRSQCLFVGVNDRGAYRVRVFRVSDGGLESTLDGHVPPCSLHPATDEYLGFRPQTGSKGTTVLVEKSTGRLLEELDHGAHILNANAFLGDGRMLVLPQRDHVVILRAMDRNQAARLLDQCGHLED